MNSYHFDRPHLIAAYSDETFVGIFVTHPNKTLTIADLVDYFDVANPTCFVAEEIPEFDEELTPHNYECLLEDMIGSYAASDLSDLSYPDLLFIPKTLH